MPNEQKMSSVKFESSSPMYAKGITTTNIQGKAMIEQTATVISVEAGYAWVVPQQKGGNCGGCAGAGCATHSPFEFMRREPQKMRVLNPLYARPGDQVVVGMQSNALLLYSLLAYIIPLIALVLAAVVGRELFLSLGLGGELGAVMGGFAGVFGGLHFANFFSSHSLQSNTFQPVILRAKEHPIYHQIIPSP